MKTPKRWLLAIHSGNLDRPQADTILTKAHYMRSDLARNSYGCGGRRETLPVRPSRIERNRRLVCPLLLSLD